MTLLSLYKLFMDGSVVVEVVAHANSSHKRMSWSTIQGFASWRTPSLLARTAAKLRQMREIMSETRLSTSFRLEKYLGNMNSV
jgi:hypothetical protein